VESVASLRSIRSGFIDESKMTNERKNITQPPDWWKVFENEAKRQALACLSGTVKRALKDCL
jgi:hypothetical protein